MLHHENYSVPSHARPLASVDDTRRDALVRQLQARIRAGGTRPTDPVREIFAKAGDKWSMLIMLLLNCGKFRHADLQRRIGETAYEGAISQRMLTLCLRALERDGLVERTSWPTVPPRVEYALTRLGKQLCEHLLAVISFLEQNAAGIERARAAFDRSETGVCED